MSSVYVVMEQAPGVNQANMHLDKVYHSFEIAESVVKALNSLGQDKFYVKCTDLGILRFIHPSIVLQDEKSSE